MRLFIYLSRVEVIVFIICFISGEQLNKICYENSCQNQKYTILKMKYKYTKNDILQCSKLFLSIRCFIHRSTNFL